MDNLIIAFRRVFSPDKKCDTCRRICADVPLFVFFYKDGTKKCVHAECK